MSPFTFFLMDSVTSLFILRGEHGVALFSFSSPHLHWALRIPVMTHRPLGFEPTSQNKSSFGGSAIPGVYVAQLEVAPSTPPCVVRSPTGPGIAPNVLPLSEGRPPSETKVQNCVNRKTPVAGVVNNNGLKTVLQPTLTTEPVNPVPGGPCGPGGPGGPCSPKATGSSSVSFALQDTRTLTVPSPDCGAHKTAASAWDHTHARSPTSNILPGLISPPCRSLYHPSFNEVKERRMECRPNPSLGMLFHPRGLTLRGVALSRKGCKAISRPGPVL